jgi:hypothetical protein
LVVQQKLLPLVVRLVDVWCVVLLKQWFSFFFFLVASDVFVFVFVTLNVFFDFLCVFVASNAFQLFVSVFFGFCCFTV